MKKSFQVSKASKGFTLKLWRGERMCLLAMDVKDPEPDFVGFAIERKEPGSTKFEVLRNRIAFSYPEPVEDEVDGSRKFDSTEAPFQKYRWIDFPAQVKDGVYSYRVTKMHMPADGTLTKGTSITLPLSLEPVTYAGFLDVGFTRNFASSQAFREKLGNPKDVNKVGRTIIPDTADEGLEFKMVTKPKDIYRWMGFEAYDLLFGILKEGVAGGKDVTVDMLAYDFNLPDMLALMKKLGRRLRLVMDDSVEEKKDGSLSGHQLPGSPESKAAEVIKKSAGENNVRRTHFSGLQHNKVIILRRKGIPFKVLCGSTNFSFRGLYIQANNLLVFEDAGIAALFGRMFDEAFANPGKFSNSELSARWHVVTTPNFPPVQICLSPHTHPEIALTPVKGAIEGASSSVFYAVAFLNQMSASGLTRAEFDRLMARPVFSYGVVNTGAKKSDGKGSLEVHKPDGSIGLVDFEFLANNAPEPFKSEWQGGQGINIHHKYVVTDFSLPTAKLFTGSSNLSPSGENGNGDHLILIEDQRVATVYAIEALRMFDHLHFRTIMNETAKKKNQPQPADKPKPMTLQKPKAITNQPRNWFEKYYVKDSQHEKDRKLFAGTK